MSDAYQAALRGGLSAAVPKEAQRKPPPPTEGESAGVKAGKVLLAKMDDWSDGSDAGGEEKKSAGYEAALRGGLSAAMPKDTAASKEKKQPKAFEESAGVKADSGSNDDKDAPEQEKAVANQAKSWLEGKTQEEKDAMIQKALSGGLSRAVSKPKAAKKEEDEDDAEPLPTSVEAWLEKMKVDSAADDADLSAAVKAALAGGASAAAIGSTEGKSKTSAEKASAEKASAEKASAEKVYSIPPGVATWIEAHQPASKWEEEAGETMTNAMYGGGIASMMAAKKKAEAKPKKKIMAEEDIIPKSIQKWLDKQNDGEVPSKEGDEPLRESSLHIPPEVAKFLEEAKKEQSAEEVTAAFSELLK